MTAERRAEAEVHGGLAQGGLEEAWNRGQARTARVRLCIARMGASIEEFTFLGSFFVGGDFLPLGSDVALRALSCFSVLVSLSLRFVVAGFFKVFAAVRAVRLSGFKVSGGPFIFSYVFVFSPKSERS